MMSVLGQILLWVGFLAGSLATVWNLENSADKWATIPWPAYGAAALVSAIGATILRVDKASKRSLSTADDSGFAGLQSALQKVTELMESLAVKLPALTCEEVLVFIDQQCMPQITDFVESRELISNRLGNQTYADIMTEFASGERYMNRAWSAAADGYVDEVERSVNLSRDFFRVADRNLKRAATGPNAANDGANSWKDEASG